ncbi:MAG: ABC transporter permease, partial [Planctomycetes bacterium]|nr:ABC transporter permease [Planctomycetota bacterium]
SFANARAVPLGYDAAPVIEVTMDFRGVDVGENGRLVARERLLEVARALPGIEEASAVNSRLFATSTSDLRVDGIDSVAALGRFNRQVASPPYFTVMRTRILRGRAFDATDGPNAPPVVVVSAAMGAALWPGKDPLGQCIRIGIGGGIQPMETAPCTTVIGIAEDAAQQNLGDDPRFMYYLPLDAYRGWPSSTLYVRARGTSATAMLEPLRAALTRAMPGDGLVVVRPLQEVVDNQMKSWELGATLFTALGGLAFVVAAVGLYGVISYGVAGRRHELGVRVALGASARDVITLVVRDGVVLALTGSLIGVLLARAAARWVQPLLFDQSAGDLRVHVAVGAAMLAVAVVASLLPARRASRADPMQALRAE